MINYALANRYARALSEALEDSELDAAVATLNELKAIFETHETFCALMCNPTISRAKRAAVATAVLRKLDGAQPLAGLTTTLLARHRFNLLPEVAVRFGEVANERLNRVSARVTAAVDLDEEQRSRLQQALESYTAKDVVLQLTVDKDILGGVVTRFNGTVIDGSLRTRLARMKAALMGQEA